MTKESYSQEEWSSKPVSYSLSSSLSRAQQVFNISIFPLFENSNSFEFLHFTYYYNLTPWKLEFWLNFFKQYFNLLFFKNLLMLNWKTFSPPQAICSVCLLRESSLIEFLLTRKSEIRFAFYSALLCFNFNKITFQRKGTTFINFYVKVRSPLNFDSKR